MTPEHAHLVLNHAPIFGVLFGLLLVGYGAWRANREFARAGMTLVLLAGLLAVPAFLTGKFAEERVEHLPGVSEPILEEHEDAGLRALVITALAGLVAGLGLFFSRAERSSFRRWSAVTIAAGLLAVSVLVWTSNLGGQIRHSEIRPGAEAAVPAESEEPEHGDRH